MSQNISNQNINCPWLKTYVNQQVFTTILFVLEELLNRNPNNFEIRNIKEYLEKHTIYCYLDENSINEDIKVDYEYYDTDNSSIEQVNIKTKLVSNDGIEKEFEFILAVEETLDHLEVLELIKKGEIEDEMETNNVYIGIQELSKDDEPKIIQIPNGKETLPLKKLVYSIIDNIEEHLEFIEPEEEGENN